MPPSVGARPGTSVAAAAHISAPKPNPMPANAAPSALRAARMLRSTATRSRTAIAEADHLADREPAGGGAVDRLAGHRDLHAGLGQAGGRVLEPLARLGVELGGGLVVADRRVGGATVLRQPGSSTETTCGCSPILVSAASIAPCRVQPFGALKTSVAWVPDWAGKRCSRRSWAFWDSIPGTVKSSLNCPPAAMAPPITAVIPRSTSSVAIRGRRAAAPAIWVRSEVMGGR